MDIIIIRGVSNMYPDFPVEEQYRKDLEALLKKYKGEVGKVEEENNGNN